MTERLDAVPAEWRPVLRSAHVALVKAELRTLRDLREAVQGAMTSVHNARFGADRNAARAQAARLVRDVAGRMRETISSALRDARVETRSAAATQVGRELDMMTRELRSVGIKATFERDGSLAYTIDEHADVHNDTLGAAISVAWSQAVLRSIAIWHAREQGSIRDAISGATAEQDHRLRRIAITETTRTFNQAHDDGIGYAFDKTSRARWMAGVFKRWDATLDRRVCAYCKDQHGRMVPYGMSFSAGIPGMVHPYCRCVQSLVFIPARVQSEEQRGHYVPEERI